MHRVPPDLPEFEIDLYQIKEPLGQGGQGTVCLYEKRGVSNGIDNSYQSLPEKIAVKIFLTKDQKQFVRESGHMAKVAKVCANEPQNVVKCYGFCTLPNRKLGLVMDPYDTDLSEMQCDLSEGKEVLRQIAMGLNQLRKLNIVHCDIKPENILKRTIF